MINKISSFFSSKKSFKIQSFTYFIASPPPRSSGYREKQFDNIFYEFINRGYTILNVSTQASTGDKQSGMWIFLIVQATNKNAELLNLNEIFNDSKMNAHSKSDQIDGLYYIDDKV